VNCEAFHRIEEIKTWTKEERDERPLYATKETVKKDIKRQAKGENWYRSGEQMKKAKTELKEEKAMEQQIQLNQVHVGASSAASECSVLPGPKNSASSITSSISSMSRSERKTWVMRKAKSLAAALVNSLLQCNKMVDVVCEAGERMELTAEAVEKMEHYEAAIERATIPEARQSLEEEWKKCAAVVADQSTYRTAAEHGSKDQAVFLKALDFADEVGPDIRMYNVCTQPDDTHGKCGLAFPSMLWWQKRERYKVWKPAKRPSNDVIEGVVFQVPL